VNDIECVKRKIRKIYNVPHRLSWLIEKYLCLW
jgi:hypothetical protein